MATPPTAVRETHVSTLFLIGDRVYKLKKPVALDFVDLSTRESREAICRREVALNRRLAPDVYLGVADVLGVDGLPCDHLVVMKRMPEDRRLATMVAAGADADACVRDVARVVAAFHARADRSPEVAAAATVEAVRAHWEANLATMEPFVGSVLDRRISHSVAAGARRFLAGRTRLFADRIARDRICDGHGDLLADDIFCMPDGPRILDCLEFDDALRWGDGLADAAFLAMDLERLGADALAGRFLAWYREFSGDAFPPQLAHHYIAYRAHVRAKVACLRVAQGDSQASASACRLLALADDHLRRARVVLTLVGGLPGTGKSTLSAELAGRRGWVVLRSDEVRKDLAGIAHTEHPAVGFGEGAYGVAATDATYSTMLDRARSLLELGESVILDASWDDARWRGAARAVAEAAHADLVELWCHAPASVTRTRLARRSEEGSDASDATAEIAARMAERGAPWPEAVPVDTDARPEVVADRAEAVVDGGPAVGPVGS